MRKFERQAPDERRQALMDATLACLAERGIERTTVRQICERAGVSIGLVSHYYSGKEALVADVYARLADDLLSTLQGEAERCGRTARERLSAFFEASFSPVVLDPDLLRVWLSFWSMSHRSEWVAREHQRTYAEYRAVLEAMLGTLATEEGRPELDTRLAAIGLSGLLDGLWVEWCLHSGTFTPAEGVRLCEACLDGMLNGASHSDGVHLNDCSIV